MAELSRDSRFGNIARDPKFRSMPKSKRKIKVDKRFRSMFTNKEFSVKYKFDKRGRPVNESSAENLRKFYGGSSDDDTDNDEDRESQDDDDSKLESDDEQAEVDNSEKKNKLQQSNKLKNKEKKEAVKKIKKKTEVKNGSDLNENDSKDGDKIDNKDDDDDDEDNKTKENSKITSKLKDLSVDYARGHANLYSDDSSSEEEESETSEVEEEIEHNWAELDKDAEEIDEPTTRLALCNMNWDRIRAVDIMVVMTSFLPPDGSIKSVTIYPTEFGIQRMKEEELKGPIEITESKKIEDDFNIDEEDSKIQMEKIREYQLNRLKYYVAVIVFDSKETAEAIYKALDGFEYESSANRMDLRVITDDKVFDQEPKEVCNKLPDISNYKPRIFITTAIQQVKCTSTWDETDIERQELADKIKKGKIDEINHDDIRQYVATSSSEEESDNENGNNLDKIREFDNNQSEKKNKSDIEKYKLILQEVQENEKKKKKNDIDVECTWGLDIKEKTEKLVKEKMEQKIKQELTPLEKLLFKKEKRKKEKKLKKKELKNNSRNASDSEDSIPSDIDMNDPYFKEEMINMKPNKAKSKKSKKDAVDSDDTTNKEDNAELELLLLNDDKLNKNHFDMNKIEKNENLSKSQKKRKMKKNKLDKSDFEDNFEINVEDPRFAAVYNSPDFNIDPSDPRYRNTKGNELIRKEKFKRQKENSKSIPVEEPPVKRSKDTKTLDVEVNSLIKRIKANTSKKIKENSLVYKL